MGKHLTTETLNKKADNQFDLVLDVIDRAKHLIHSGRDYGYETDLNNTALQAINDAEQNVDRTKYDIPPPPKVEETVEIDDREPVVSKIEISEEEFSEITSSN